jgi:hypothetical protein
MRKVIDVQAPSAIARYQIVVGVRAAVEAADGSGLIGEQMMAPRGHEVLVLAGAGLGDHDTFVVGGRRLLLGQVARRPRGNDLGRVGSQTGLCMKLLAQRRGRPRALRGRLA